MMQGGPILLPWGIPFGGIWFLLIPVAIFMAIGMLKLLASYSHRRERSDGKIRRVSIQDHIIQLAFRKSGLLTVTDVVAETGLSFKKAEKALNGMVDFARVNMRVSESGFVVYEFVEILHKDSVNARTLGEMGV